jgi:hypothetical protein
MHSQKKKELIELLARSLDITPDMYNVAQSKVRGIENYLQSVDHRIIVYKQGSFKHGTIVRPYKKDDYDIDLVVELPMDKNSVQPSAVKKALGLYLQNQNYRISLQAEEGRRCWTLKYPRSSDGKIAAFHIDLVPSVLESAAEKATINPPTYRNTAIAITHIEDRRTNPYTYGWRSSNPQGYSKWFDDINYGKYGAIMANDRQRVFESYRNMFASASDVGDDYTRSPLQMVIQILKRHRDVMYNGTPQQDYKPISIIITTLVAKIVEANNIVTNNTYDLLNTVIEGLVFYSNLLTHGITSDSDDFKTKQLISKRMVNGFAKWYIPNPTDSKENFADKWCKDSTYASEFFRWVKRAKQDLLDILDGSQKSDDIKGKLKYCLGQDVANVLGGFVFSETSQPRVMSSTIPGAKPYRF